MDPTSEPGANIENKPPLTENQIASDWKTGFVVLGRLLGQNPLPQPKENQ